MRVSFFALALMMVPGIALAQRGGATCTIGGGCSCFVVEDAGIFPILLGETAAGQVGLSENIVMDRSTNTTFRTTRSLGEVHRSFGGSGDCPRQEEPETITPLDGTWRWRTLGETTRGCPDMLAAALAANREETLAQRVMWDGAFHPARLAENLPQPEIGGMSPYEWRNVGVNRWVSDNIQSTECGDGTCVSVSVTLAMNLVAENRVSGLLTTRSRVEGGESAILAMFGMGDCQVRVRYVIDHIGP